VFESIKAMQFAVQMDHDKIVKQKLFVSTDSDAVCGEKWPGREKQNCEKRLLK
jgi:hypothetical protein